MRLFELLRNHNGNGISAAQYRMLKRRLPLVIQYSDSEPNFRDKPKTKKQAIYWIRNRHLCERYEKENGLQDLPRTLILIPAGVKHVNLDEFLMKKFKIQPDEIH